MQTNIPVTAVIAELIAKNKKELLTLWHQRFAGPPPKTLRKELIVPILAYSLQEAALGGLSLTTRKRLQRLMEEQRRVPGRLMSAVVPDKRRATLVRTWRGETHEVIVTDEGFLYRDQPFKSLSPIARLITGTQWSGPAFFGTRAAEKKL